MLGVLRFLFVLLAVPPVLLACLCLFAVSDEPLTSERRQLSQNEMQRAKQILNAPAAEAQQLRTVELNEDDLNVVGNYLFNHLLESAARIRLGRDTLHLAITLTLPRNLFGPYLNVTFDLTKTRDYPVIKGLKIGSLEVGDEFAGQLIETIIRYTALKEYYLLAAQHIKTIEIQPDKLSITYLTTFQTADDEFMPQRPESYQSLVFYQHLIDQVVQQHDPNWLLSLADIMRPLFSAAYQRSTTSNAADENRALLIAVSTYVNKDELGSYLPIKLSTEKYYPVYLYKRFDLAKHFVASAALAATGAASLAEMLGQEKELSDADGGSGFSFIDLAGDRAGLKFGQTATASSKSARKVQKAMRDIKDYKVFMPDVRDLPERMTQQQFRQQFGSPASENYLQMLEKIDRRIDSLSIYQAD